MYKTSLNLDRLFPAVCCILGTVLGDKQMYKSCVCMNLDSLHQVVDTPCSFSGMNF